MDNPTLTAKRYAEAFFFTAEKDETTFEDCISDFNVFSSLFSEKRDLYNILTHTLIHPEKKVELIGRLLANANKTAKNFICVLVRRRKMNCFKSIATEIKRLYRKKKGIRGLIVKSAVSLTAEEYSKLEAILGRKFGKVSIRTVVDESIIGGLVIHFGNQVVDDSLYTRMKRMRDMLNKIDEVWLLNLSEQPSLAL